MYRCTGLCCGRAPDPLPLRDPADDAAGQVQRLPHRRAGAARRPAAPAAPRGPRPATASGSGGASSPEVVGGHRGQRQAARGGQRRRAQGQQRVAGAGPSAEHHLAVVLDQAVAGGRTRAGAPGGRSAAAAGGTHLPRRPDGEVDRVRDPSGRQADRAAELVGVGRSRAGGDGVRPRPAAAGPTARPEVRCSASRTSSSRSYGSRRRRRAGGRSASWRPARAAWSCPAGRRGPP